MRRFARHLSAWYSVHRFRTPPQTQAILDEAVRGGVLAFEAASVRSAAVAPEGIEVALKTRGRSATRRETFGAIINCTGPDPRADAATNPFLKDLLNKGMARPANHRHRVRCRRRMPRDRPGRAAE